MQPPSRDDAARAQWAQRQEAQESKTQRESSQLRVPSELKARASGGSHKGEKVLRALKSGGLGLLKGVARGSALAGAGVCALLCFASLYAIPALGVWLTAKGGEKENQAMKYTGVVLASPLLAAAWLLNYGMTGSGSFKPPQK